MTAVSVCFPSLPFPATLAVGRNNYSPLKEEKKKGKKKNCELSIVKKKKSLPAFLPVLTDVTFPIRSMSVGEAYLELPGRKWEYCRKYCPIQLVSILRFCSQRLIVGLGRLVKDYYLEK